MLAATFAMTVTGLNEWRINFKPHAATQTTPANALAHPRLSIINSQLSTLGDNANYADENGFLSTAVVVAFVSNAEVVTPAMIT
jgi:hypothetical protein